jgi:DNA-binding response OmpR family regulator
MAAVLNIIVVEDHDLLREEIVDFLQRPGWDVRSVDSGEQLDIALRTHPADVVVLDLNLPGEDGLSIAARLRAAMPTIRIVMLTGRTRPSERADGYATGADVYLTKPTNVRELAAVINTLGQRLQAQPAATGFVLDGRRMRLLAPDGQVAELTLAETEILTQLALAPERQLDAEFLLRKLSQEYNLVKSRDALTVLISRLRQKLAQHIGDENMVKAIRGFGYKLNVPIQIHT